jgi:aspartyl-tRNA(Asn)/glutamyl-tRNA(Gln) amidotransferase subunit A
VLQQAEAVDEKRAKGEPLGPLAGVPVVVKDNLCERGQPLTCASRILENYRPPYDAHVVERLRAADAVLLGRGNMDEFAMGSSTEHSAYGPARNPWDTSRAPGGSSGGSAVSVAARLAPLALGSDTGGSVRQPGAFCGVTALKPTYGRVSRYGLVAFASSLDNVGPMGRDVRDVASVLQVIAGTDPRDATSVDQPVGDYLAACDRPAGPLRVGLMRHVDQSANDPAVTRSFEEAMGQLEALGMQVVPVDLPHARYAVATYYLVATAEASSNLARFDGMRYGLRVPAEDVKSTYCATRTAGFGSEVQLRILLGTYALSAGYYDAYYLKAQKVRTLIMRDFERAFETCDVLASPTAPTPAFPLGAKTQDPLSMYLGDIYTLPASLAGLPAMSVPCGFNDQGLPVGLQLMAPHFEEERLFSVASAYERATEHVSRLAPVD